MLNRDLSISVGLAVMLHAGLLAMLGMRVTTPAAVEPGSLSIDVVLLETPLPEVAVVQAVSEMSDWNEPLPVEPASGEMVEHDLPVSQPTVLAESFIPERSELATNQSVVAQSELREMADTGEMQPPVSTDAPALVLEEQVNVPREAAPPVETSSATEPAQQSPPARSSSPATTPVASSNPKPTYPSIARRRGWEGVVELRVEVLATGRVGRVEVRKSAGRAVLDDAAIKAVRGWVFTPATQVGEAVRHWVEVPVEFRLDG